MFWFKNVMVYRLTKVIDLSTQTLGNALQAQAFVPCGSHDLSKFGWIAPLSAISDSLVYSAVNQHLIVAQKEEKILPAAVIKQTFEQRLAQLENKEARKFSKVEKQTLKDDVIHELLPRAFTKTQHTALWIDADRQLIYINAASAKRAEDSLALLRKTLGSLPVVPLSFAENISQVMTNWIAQESLPQWLDVTGEAEFVSTKDESVLRCKQQVLESEEMLNHIQAGKVITKLALTWEQQLSFVLHQDATLKRLKFDDQIRQQNDDIAKEDVAQRFDADFILMTATLSELMVRLFELFSGESELLGQQ